jgi:hypothetical protein
LKERLASDISCGWVTFVDVFFWSILNHSCCWFADCYLFPLVLVWISEKAYRLEMFQVLPGSSNKNLARWFEWIWPCLLWMKIAMSNFGPKIHQLGHWIAYPFANARHFCRKYFDIGQKCTQKISKIDVKVPK